MPFATRFSAVLVLLLTCASPAAAAGSRSGVTTNPDTTTIVYTFGCYEIAGYESNHPEWTGVDVYRREPAGCGAWQRINDTPYARAYNQSFQYTLVDHPPAQRTLYEYEWRAVDADRNPAAVPFYNIDGMPNAWATSPALSAPTIRAVVSDGGWCVNVWNAEPGNCYISGYAYHTAELDAVLDGTTVVDLYGTWYCGSIEGCFLDVKRVVVVNGTVATQRTSWGRLKALYR
jgi:hypothetical protein